MGFTARTKGKSRRTRKYNKKARKRKIEIEIIKKGIKNRGKKNIKVRKGQKQLLKKRIKRV